jgi:hypothetical protein
VFEGNRHGNSKSNHITPTIRDSKEKPFNRDLKPHENNPYDDSKKVDRVKNLSAVKEKVNRPTSFNTRSQSTENNFTFVKKHKPKLPPNDFDPDTVKEGLDLIDLEIQDIDQNLPEEELENDVNQTEDLIRANKILRDKVSQIADLVVSAINKAAVLRKQITTHRDGPEDPELKSKLKEINKYQKAIMKMKYPKIHRNYKIQEMQDEIKILKSDIDKLENEKNTLKMEQVTKKKAYNEVMKGNQNQYDKIDALKENLKTEKEEVRIFHLFRLKNLKRLKSKMSLIMKLP